MTISQRRRRFVIVMLALYWPAFFILAHIPMPDIVRQAGMSDKSLHFIAYLVLVFLIWFTIKPYRKVHWRKPAVWLVLLVIVWYGVLDEWLQGYVGGRSPDVRDFFADLAGALVSLILLSIFEFWSAFLLIMCGTLFALSNISRENLSDVLPGINASIHLFGYALATLVWIKFLDQKARCARGVTSWEEVLDYANIIKIKLLISMFLPPLLFLAAVKFSSIILGREVRIIEIALALAGIILPISATIIVSVLWRFNENKQLSSTEN